MAARRRQRNRTEDVQHASVADRTVPFAPEPIADDETLVSRIPGYFAVVKGLLLPKEERG